MLRLSALAAMPQFVVMGGGIIYDSSLPLRERFFGWKVRDEPLGAED